MINKESDRSHYSMLSYAEMFWSETPPPGFSPLGYCKLIPSNLMTCHCLLWSSKLLDNKTHVTSLCTCPSRPGSTTATEKRSAPEHRQRRGERRPWRLVKDGWVFRGFSSGPCVKTSCKYAVAPPDEGAGHSKTTGILDFVCFGAPEHAPTCPNHPLQKRLTIHDEGRLDGHEVKHPSKSL